MTIDEAEKVATILSEADHGCPTCDVRILFQLVADAFPEHKSVWERWLNGFWTDNWKG